MLIISLIVLALTLVCDRLVKSWAVNSLAAVSDIPLIDGVFHLHYAENRGAAFSMLTGQIWFFVVITVVALAVMAVIFVRYYKRHWTLALGLSLIVSGAIGNLIDRVSLGYVIDMFYFKLINFAIFNVADTCVTIGTVLIIIYILFINGKGKERKHLRAD